MIVKELSIYIRTRNCLMDSSGFNLYNQGMKLIISILLMLCFSCSITSTKNVANLNYSEDLQFAMNQLEQHHPNLYSKTSKKILEDFKIKLLSGIITTKEHLVLSVMKILNLIGDSHTAIQLTSELGFKSIVPKFHRQDDSLFLTATEPSDSEYLGQEVVEINNYPTSYVLQAIDKISAYENQSKKWSSSEYFVAIPKLLSLLELGKYEDKIEMKISSGKQMKSFTFQIPINSFDRVYTKEKSPLWLRQSSNTYYWVTKIEKSPYIYFQYNACREMKDKKFSDLIDELVTLNQENNSNFQSLVIDLRRNSGGNSSIIKPLFEALKSKRLKYSKLFVIVSRQTFSSAILNALTLKNEYDAQIIGEPTGGAPSHFGEQKSFVLPKSGIEIKYSTKYFEDKHIKTDSLYPDIKIKFDPKYIGSSNDQVIEEILRIK